MFYCISRLVEFKREVIWKTSVEGLKRSSFIPGPEIVIFFRIPPENKNRAREKILVDKMFICRCLNIAGKLRMIVTT